MTTESETAAAEPVTNAQEPTLSGQSPEDYEATKWAKDSWFTKDRFPGNGFLRLTERDSGKPALINLFDIKVIVSREDHTQVFCNSGCIYARENQPDILKLIAIGSQLDLDPERAFSRSDLDAPFGTEAGIVAVSVGCSEQPIRRICEVRRKVSAAITDDRSRESCRINQAAAEEDVRILRDGLLGLAKRHLDWEHLGSQQDSERLLRLADFAEGSAHLVLASRVAEHVPGLDVVMATMRFDVDCVSALWRRAAVECQKAERGANQEGKDDAFQVALQGLNSIAVDLQLPRVSEIHWQDLPGRILAKLSVLRGERNVFSNVAGQRREFLEQIAKLAGATDPLPQDDIGLSNAILAAIVRLLERAQQTLTAKVADAGLAEHRAELAAQAARARAGQLTADELLTFWKAMPKPEQDRVARSVGAAFVDDNLTLEEANKTLHSSNEALRDANRELVAKELLLLERNRQAQRCITDYLEGIATLQSRNAVLESRLAVYEPREATPEPIEAEATVAHSVKVNAPGGVVSDG